MAEFLVDKLLNGIADAVLDKLREEFKLVTGVEDEVKDLHSKLQIIRQMLQDVQRRKLKEKPVGMWLEKLEDVAYDVDDVLDEWKTRVQELKLKADEDPNSPSPQMKKTVSKNLRNKVCSFLLSICSCFKEVSIRHDIAQRIKELNGRMQKISNEADQFKFVSSDLNSNFGDFKRIITTSSFDESEICGREFDKNTIVSKLLYDTSDANDGTCIVSIVGTGGIGKTTLAQLVYNDNRVKEEHFELTKWVCVWDPFDQIRIAKAILEGPEKSSAEASELETLVQRIKALVSGKKFLLVLDDVWTEDDSKWKPIWDSLKHGAPGSRILVTTRSERVARVMGTNYTHPLNQLRDLDCWTIMSRLAFSGRSEDERERLTEIGWQILKKCKGLPLAAKFLGSLLQLKDTVEQWQNVLKSEIWELEEARFNLFPHIYLSYNELSPEMKRCFSYCAVFPKDTKIIVEEVIRQWMAQGYLSSSGRVEEPELKGYECFSNLAMRSFFQDFERGGYKDKIVWCKMHDIVHDFAQHLTNGECLVIDKELDETETNSHEKVRHLWSNVEVRSSVHDGGKLRSFFGKNSRVIVDPEDLFHCLKCVRVLSLDDTELEEVPRAVGNFVHLRFLNLSGNPLKVLPDEICNLYNLETLDISFCDQLTELPQRIGNLINLRHLLNRRTDELKQLPRGLEKLTSLRTLKEFKVGNGYSKLGYLKNLNQLLGELRILFYEVNEVEDFDTAALRDKTGIQRLTIALEELSHYDESIIGRLQVPPKLEDFTLFDFPYSYLPKIWVSCLNNVRYLRILRGGLAILPVLGRLPSLELLSLNGLGRIEVLGREFLGITENSAVDRFPIFPKLKDIFISDMGNLKIWEDLLEEDENVVSAIMPCLQKLILRNCRVLEKLPHRLLGKAPLLNHLDLSYSPNLKLRYKKDRGEDWNHISQIPNVEFG